MRLWVMQSLGSLLRHESHHCVEDVWRGMNINPLWLDWLNSIFLFVARGGSSLFRSQLERVGVPTVRFCTCRVLGYGSTFYDLVVHCAEYIRKNMKVVYTPSNPEHIKYAKKILDMTMSVRIAKLKYCLDESGNMTNTKKMSLLQQKVDMFLAILNSNWKSPSSLWHHCTMGCPCGGLPQHQLAEQAANLFVEVVLASKPGVPALSRWLKCSRTARWFLILAWLFVGWINWATIK